MVLIFKIILYLTVFLTLIFSCKKSEVTAKDYNQFIFDSNGKEFLTKQSKQVLSTDKYIHTIIPADAVVGKHYFECYTIYCDTAKIKNYYINWWVGDINLFGSSAVTLNVPATIKLPMPYNTYSASNLYKPYKVKLSKNEDAAIAFNNVANRTLITDYTWDNTARYIIIKTTDLNAAYVIAKPK